MSMDPETLRRLGEGRLAELRRTAARRALATEALASASPRQRTGLTRRARSVVGGALMSAGAMVAGSRRDQARPC